jgi:hypothetical protein
MNDDQTQTLTITWLLCPYYCPILPNHYSSIADVMRRAASHDGPVHLMVPPAVERLRGTHDNRWGFASTCHGRATLDRGV